MVHTFVLRFDKDDNNPFSRSAALLDYRRLGKQRVEATQILNVLLDYQTIIDFYSLKTISLLDQNFQNYLDRDKELLSIRKWYTSRPKRLLVLDNKILEVDKNYKGDGRKITLSWGSHPALRMWYGYEDSLKIYITAHIFEWVKRGYKNTMNIPSISLDRVGKVIHPWWAIHRTNHLAILASMLRKEKERNERPWYKIMVDDQEKRKNLFDFEDEELKFFLEKGYFWPTNLSLDDLNKFFV